MWHPKLAAPVLAGVLLLGGATACGDDGSGLEVEDREITPGVDPGEEPVIDEGEGVAEEDVAE